MQSLSRSEIASVQKQVVEAGYSKGGLEKLHTDVNGAIETHNQTFLGFSAFNP